MSECFLVGNRCCGSGSVSSGLGAPPGDVTALHGHGKLRYDTVRFLLCELQHVRA